MKLAQDIAHGNRALSVELVQDIQADALSYAVETIQVAVDDGVPIDSALAMVRIKAGNLVDGQQTTKRKL